MSMKHRQHNEELQHLSLTAHVQRESGCVGVSRSLGRCALALEASTWHVEGPSNPKGALWSNALIRTCSR
jgi:hypothetical protein